MHNNEIQFLQNNNHPDSCVTFRDNFRYNQLKLNDVIKRFDCKYNKYIFPLSTLFKIELNNHPYKILKKNHTVITAEQQK